MTSKPKRRIIVPTPETHEVSVELVNETQRLLDDAKHIIGAELARYRSKTSKGVSLDLKEARVVQGYLDALTKLQREEREQSRAEDFSNMSNEDLLALAEELFGKTRPRLSKSEDSES